MATIQAAPAVALLGAGALPPPTRRDWLALRPRLSGRWGGPTCKPPAGPCRHRPSPLCPTGRPGAGCSRTRAAAAGAQSQNGLGTLALPLEPAQEGPSSQQGAVHEPHKTAPREQQGGQGQGGQQPPVVPPAEKAEEASRMEYVEAWVEQGIFNTRFFTLLAVFGSLLGAALCFVRGSGYVLQSLQHFVQRFHSDGASREILFLVRALDVYLMGTVLLIFGGGLYELFIDSLHVSPSAATSASLHAIPSIGAGQNGWQRSSPRSSFFGLFALKSRPKWLGITSLDEMKAKLGHAIVMVLLVGMFEQTKKVRIATPTDFLIFSTAVTMSAVCLWLLNKLHSDDH